MRVARNVDYLVYNTLKLSSMFEPMDKQASRIPNYDFQWTDAHTGAKIYHGNKKTDKFHIVFGGSAVEYLECSPIDLIEDELKNGAEFTRIDLAVTQEIDEDGLVTPLQMVEWFRAGRIKSSLVDGGCQSFRRDFLGDEKGEKTRLETTYIGDWSKRGRKGIFRAYDKGLDLDLDQFLIARHEVEIKREKAQVTARSLAAGDSVGACLRGRLDVDADEWRALFDSEPTDFMTGKKKRDRVEEDGGSRWKWLIEQVAKPLGVAIAEEVFLTEGQENYASFMRKVRHEYDKRMIELVDTSTDLE